jgi:hypothetical protein
MWEAYRQGTSEDEAKTLENEAKANPIFDIDELLYSGSSSDSEEEDPN